MGKLRVIEIVGVMNRGGAESMLMDIFRYTCDKIDYIFLVNDYKKQLGRKGAYDDEILNLGGRILYIASQGSIGPFKYIKDLKHIIDDVKPDLVHTHLNAKSGFIAYALHKAGVKRIIAHCHADIKFRGNIFNRFIKESELILQSILINRYATDFWGCSVNANRRLYRGKNLENSRVINNAIDCNKYASVQESQWKNLRQQYKVEDNAIILGNVGRIVPHKNIAFIVEILSVLKQRGLLAYLVVAGRNDDNAYVEKMMNRAADLNIANQIILLGERPDIPIVMNTFDIFVGPALKEGFGLVAVEAQAAGIPCVLYKGFPKTVDMQLGLVDFMYDFSVESWSNQIEKHIGQAHSLCSYNVLDNIKKLGFDAKENAQVIYKLYSRE